MEVCFRGGPNPQPDARVRPSVGGVIFREDVSVEAGPHAARIQIQFSPFAVSDRVVISAVHEGAVIAETEIAFDDPDALRKADHIILSLNLNTPSVVTFEGRVSNNAASTHLRLFTLMPGAPETAPFHFYPPNQPVRRVSSVVIGTTAVCNANCSHCPTNKAYSRAQAKGIMTPALFERLVRESLDLGFDGTFMFGLFGDPLQDPLFADRVAFIRRMKPDASIAISTNGAMYDPAKHREALAQIDSIAIHIEAMTPDVYETHMRPLKVHRTFPRAERILAENPGRVHIVSPIHKDNLEQVASLKSHWEGLGANETEFVALSNRAGKSPNYEALALAPTAIGCGPEMVESEFIVDWDGAVLTCCQDFHRLGQLGDLTRESVAETLASAERRRVRDLLNRKEWGCLGACAGCKIDSEEMVKGLVAAKIGEVDHFSFGPIQFRFKGHGSVEPDGIRIQTRDLWSSLRRLLTRRGSRKACLIFGPYRRLPPGRYLFNFDLDEIRPGLDADLTIEVVSQSGVMLGRSRYRGPATLGKRAMTLDLDGFDKLEFRTRARGLDAVFTGVRVDRESPPAATTVQVRSGVERAQRGSIRMTD